MNLPPAACCVNDLHATLKCQISSFHPHQDRGSSHIRGQTTLPACNRLRLPWTDIVHAVLPAIACCAKDIPAALNRRIPSFQYAKAPDRAPSGVTQSASCLHVIAHVSVPTLSPSFVTGGVSCSFYRMLNRSFDDGIVICYSNVSISLCDDSYYKGSGQLCDYFYPHNTS